MIYPIGTHLIVLFRDTYHRLNAQTDDDDVIIFPVDFLPRILTGKMDSMVVETLRMYPRLIYSRIIVLPIICDGQATVITVINPIGIILPEFASRSVSVILSLHPGQDDTKPDLSNTARRLRLFFNKVVHYDTSCNSDVKFSSRNLKIYGPTGKVKNCFAVLSNVCNMFLSYLKCRSNILA